MLPLSGEISLEHFVVLASITKLRLMYWSHRAYWWNMPMLLLVLVQQITFEPYLEHTTTSNFPTYALA